MITSILAARRLTTLVVEDEISAELRGRFPQHASKIGYLLNCRRCTSIWAAALVILLQRRLLGRFLVNTLAISELVIVSDTALERIAKKESMFN